MSKMTTCVLIEGKKFFKSKLPLITILAFSLVPFVGGFFMFVLKDPNLAESLGFISTKAQIMGTANWTSYVQLLAQAVSIGGLIVFGFITSWMFGREYSDRTIKDLLALPISRTMIVCSKFIVIGLWCLALSIFILIVGLFVGKLVGISGWSMEIMVEGATVFMICSLLTILLSTPVAFFASIGCGYLSPLGFIIFTVVLSQIVAAIGYGEFFPWSIPALVSGITGTTIFNYISFTIVVSVSILGLLATISWWKYSDQTYDF